MVQSRINNVLQRDGGFQGQDGPMKCGDVEDGGSQCVVGFQVHHILDNDRALFLKHNFIHIV